MNTHTSQQAHVRPDANLCHNHLRQAMGKPCTISLCVCVCVCMCLCVCPTNELMAEVRLRCVAGVAVVTNELSRVKRLEREASEELPGMHQASHWADAPACGVHQNVAHVLELGHLHSTAQVLRPWFAPCAHCGHVSSPVAYSSLLECPSNRGTFSAEADAADVV